jgi:hypothetical protein
MLLDWFTGVQCVNPCRPTQLPAGALLQQLKTHGDSQLLRLMNSKFLRIAIWRTTDQAELEVLLKDGLLQDIHRSLPSTLGHYLFHFFLHVLMKYELPRRGTPRHQELRSILATALHCISGGFCCLPRPKLHPERQRPSLVSTPRTWNFT